MPDVSSFDWIRWVDAPVLIAIAGWLVRQGANTHAMDLRLTAECSRLSSQAGGLQEQIDDLNTRQNMMLEAMLEKRNDD